MSWFTLALGVFALAGGIAEVRGLDAPLLPLLLIVIGARILIGSRIAVRP